MEDLSTGQFLSDVKEAKMTNDVSLPKHMTVSNTIFLTPLNKVLDRLYDDVLK